MHPLVDAIMKSHPLLAEKPEGDEGLKTAINEFNEAASRKDVDAQVAALKNFFLILDAQPHEEGEHD